jgi:putative transposase
MSHSFSTIWIHAVWATKNREPLILPKLEKQLYSFLFQELEKLGCPCRIINGMPDHIHLLFLLNPQKSVSEVVKQLKGASSHWVNQQDFYLHKFAWQTGFAAYSVSESVKGKVFSYIQNQKEHHRNVSFQEEYESIIQKIQNRSNLKNG